MKHATWTTLAALLLATMAAAAQDRIGSAVVAAVAGDGEARVLVVLADADRLASAGTAEVAAEVDALLASLPAGGVRLERRFQTVPAVALSIDADGLAALAGSSRVQRVDLDEGGSGSLLQSVPLAQISALQVLGFNGAGTTVAILDSGVRLDHQSFAGRIVDEACFCTTCCPNGQASQTGPGSGANSHPHGTNVAGIAVGGTGVAGVPAGVAGGADIISVRVLDANNSFCCSSDIIAGLDWLRSNHPDATVANLSLGTNARFAGHCDTATSFTQAFATVINGLVGQGTSVTVSSGNNGSSLDMQAPACVQNATSVGAVWDANVGSATVLGCTDAGTAADQVTCFSNLGTTTDLVAPGAPVTAAGTASPTATSTFSGTSMAAPMTAGCIALLGQAFPDRSPAQIDAVLTASTVRVLRPPMVQDYPRLDCLDAFLRLDRVFQNGFQ
jgi:subtilisin family serine protease